MSDVTEQLLFAFSDYISECRYVPKDRSCSQSYGTIESLKREISQGKPLVEILVWNHDGKIIEVLSMSNYKSQVLHRSKERQSIQKQN